MAKESGLSWETLTVDTHDNLARVIKNDIVSLDISIPRGSQDVTGLDSLAMERLQLLADSNINLAGVFNDTVGFSHEVFKTIFSTSVTRSVIAKISGQQLLGEYLISDYIVTRAATGEFTWSAPAVLNSTVVPTWTEP